MNRRWLTVILAGVLAIGCRTPKKNVSVLPVDDYHGTRSSAAVGRGDPPGRPPAPRAPDEPTARPYQADSTPAPTNANNVGVASAPATSTIGRGDPPGRPPAPRAPDEPAARPYQADSTPAPPSPPARTSTLTAPNKPATSLPLPGIQLPAPAGSPPVSSIRLRIPDWRNGTESLLHFRPIAVPESDVNQSILPELGLQPIYVEPLFATEAEWRDWQLARQRATTKTRQAERDILTDGLQRFLQQGARVP